MNVRLHHHLDRPLPDFLQIAGLLRALVAFVAALWAGKPQQDTAIAWEDGEETSRR